MARVLILTDRHPEDADWKGAMAWSLIRSLCESQHQVLVLTTLDPESISISHPRLTLARPAPSWAVSHLPQFIQAIMLFNPDVIHTFALKPSRLWKNLTLWPYLNVGCRILPRAKRFSIVFEASDLSAEDASLVWLQGSEQTVVFSPEHKAALAEKLGPSIEISPFEIDMRPEHSREKDHPFILVPAPVGEWRNPQRDLLMLAKHLSENPDLHAYIAEGWGDWPASSRRQAWAKMMNIADRLHMLEPMTFSGLLSQAARAQALWCEPLLKDSWRDLIASHVSQSLNIPAYGLRPALAMGSTANFLSRLFAGSVDS